MTPDTATNVGAPAPQAPTLFLGIDVGKDRLDLALAVDGRVHSKDVRNEPSGHRALVRWLGRFADAPGAVHACLEASGGYEDAAAVALHAAGLTVSVVNPRQTAAYAAVQLRRSKTDRADAALLARFCERERPRPWTPPSEAARELRRLTRAIDALKRDRERTRNRRRRTSPGPAQDAFDAVIGAYGDQIGTLESAVEAHLAVHADLARQRDLLLSVPGVGAQTAATVIAEIGDVEFASARAVAAFAGLVPRHHESGSSVRRRPRLSKAGNGRLRRALYFPAICAMRYNPAVRVFAARLLGRGKSKMSVVGASMRKLLHICYGVLKSGRPFDPSLHPA